MVKKYEVDIETLLENIESVETEDNTKILLNNGIPAYIKEPGMPKGIMIKLYPDGKRETIKIDENFQESVVSF